MAVRIPGPDLTLRLRKVVLSVHLAVSVGWIGALAAYLSLDARASTSRDPEQLRASYQAMVLIVDRVIVPLAVFSLLTGVLISAVTRWGLIRHYWVLLSLIATTVAVVVLLLEAETVRRMAAIASDPGTTDTELLDLGGTLLHSLGGLVVLLFVLVLNVFKPRGMTGFGWRQRSER